MAGIDQQMTETSCVNPVHNDCIHRFADFV